MKELAQDKLTQGNPSQLGDPVSLKAETSNSHPTDQDRGASSASPAKKTTSGSKVGGGVEKETGHGAPKADGTGGGEGEGKNRKTLAQSYQESNKSMLGDPVSLKAEKDEGSEPTEQDRGAMSVEERKKRGSKL